MQRLFTISLLCMLILAACDSGPDEPEIVVQNTPVPSLTPTPFSTPTPPANATIVTLTPSPTGVPLQFTSDGLDVYRPPINIDLPDGWLSGYDIIVNPDIDGELRAFPVAIYRGPITGGTGTIVLVWGFQSTTPNEVIAPSDATNVYRDGLRLWRFLLNSADCNIGTDLQRNFTLGAVTATGTFVSAVDCPPGPDGVQEPDVSGWFAGARVDNLPFVFFAFTDPETILGPARDEMQAILDTVEFRVIEFLTATPPPVATAAP